MSESVVHNPKELPNSENTKDDQPINMDGDENKIHEKEKIQVQDKEKNNEEVKLSKRAIKRKLKEQMIKEMRKQSKQKKKEYKRLRREKEGQDNCDNLNDNSSGNVQENGSSKPETSRRKKKTEEDVADYHVVIDCQFDSLMTEKELKSFTTQILQLYGYNSKNSEKPIHLYFTSLHSESVTLHRLNNVIRGFSNWKFVTVTDKPYYEYFTSPEMLTSYYSTTTPTTNTIITTNPNKDDSENDDDSKSTTNTINSENKNITNPNQQQKEKKEQRPNDFIYYLTSEATQILEKMEPKKVYIIGGLVDHNRLVGLTYKHASSSIEAQRANVIPVKLPLDDYLKIYSRKVLTVNHVFQILSDFVGSDSWLNAFRSSIPSRKTENAVEVLKLSPSTTTPSITTTTTTTTSSSSSSDSSNPNSPLNEATSS